jgi:hypothetical protein
MNGVAALIKEAQVRPFSPSTMGGHGKKMPSMNWEVGPPQAPNLSAS